MTVRLTRGRSRRSMLVVALEDLHWFVWVPSFGGGSVGSTVRWRSRGGRDWTHLRLVLWQRNRISWQPERSGRFLVRPTVTIFEVSRWRTRAGTSQRWGLKQYLRLKLAAGGRQVA